MAGQGDYYTLQVAVFQSGLFSTDSSNTHRTASPVDHLPDSWSICRAIHSLGIQDCVPRLAQESLAPHSGRREYYG